MTLARQLIPLVLFSTFAIGLSACASGPVESDPAKAEARIAALRQDCYSRGGTWSEDSRVCVGADPIRR